MENMKELIRKSSFLLLLSIKIEKPETNAFTKKWEVNYQTRSKIKPERDIAIGKDVDIV